MVRKLFIGICGRDLPQTQTSSVALRYDTHREMFLRGDNPSSSSGASEGLSE